METVAIRPRRIQKNCKFYHLPYGVSIETLLVTLPESEHFFCTSGSVNELTETRMHSTAKTTQVSNKMTCYRHQSSTSDTKAQLERELVLRELLLNFQRWENR